MCTTKESPGMTGSLRLRIFAESSAPLQAQGMPRCSATTLRSLDVEAGATKANMVGRWGLNLYCKEAGGKTWRNFSRGWQRSLASKRHLCAISEAASGLPFRCLATDAAERGGRGGRGSKTSLVLLGRDSIGAGPPRLQIRKYSAHRKIADLDVDLKAEGVVDSKIELAEDSSNFAKFVAENRRRSAWLTNCVSLRNACPKFAHRSRPSQGTGKIDMLKHGQNGSDFSAWGSDPSGLQTNQLLALQQISYEAPLRATVVVLTDLCLCASCGCRRAHWLLQKRVMKTATAAATWHNSSQTLR